MIRKEDIKMFRETCEPHQLWWNDEQVARHLNEHPLPSPSKPQLMAMCAETTVKEVLEELAKRGLRPLTLDELRAPVAQYEAAPIPRPRVSYLGWDGGELRLSQEWDDRSYYGVISVRK